MLCPVNQATWGYKVTRPPRLEATSHAIHSKPSHPVKVPSTARQRASTARSMQGPKAPARTQQHVQRVLHSQRVARRQLPQRQPVAVRQRHVQHQRLHCACGRVISTTQCV